MTNNLQPLRVDDRVIIPGIHGRPDEPATVSYINRERNWCRLRTRGLQKGEGKIALTLTRANEFERLGK